MIPSLLPATLSPAREQRSWNTFLARGTPPPVWRQAIITVRPRRDLFLSRARFLHQPSTNGRPVAESPSHAKQKRSDVRWVWMNRFAFGKSFNCWSRCVHLELRSRTNFKCGRLRSENPNPRKSNTDTAASRDIFHAPRQVYWVFYSCMRPIWIVKF